MHRANICYLLSVKKLLSDYIKEGVARKVIIILTIIEAHKANTMSESTQSITAIAVRQNAQIWNF